MGMENLEEILDDFSGNLKATRGTISEQTFNIVFKPVFEGRVGENTRLIDKWVELAGNEFSPVDLIGDDGTVVATVSGILKPITENREEYKTILGRFEEATSVMRINPIKAIALEENIKNTVEQGLLASNAKSRPYITYHNKEDTVEVPIKDDLYDF